MVRTGEVVEKNGNLLSVVFDRPEACEHCNGCIKKHCVRVAIPGEAEVGDLVEVELPEKNVVGASAVAYMVPLVALIGGLFAGVALHGPLGVSMDPNLFAAILGLVCLALGLLVVYGIDRVLRKRKSWQPRLLTAHKRDV